ncbi:MAG: 16S rRNA (guanine(966)-N(2))-methyltransferase RsmD [Chloroflexi bacterium]|nr:MAG: 16S rRNA (guanine(966)-N(2))-methyltransferase RsmD [Chloroflexota bacterium]
MAQLRTRVRVIAGIAKGRTLDAPRGGATRPATDRIRETLFAILEPILDEARVLDLFAGAGTLGIEALSRGASSVTFVERSAEALKALRKNIATTHFDERAEVVAANVLGFLEQIAGPYDAVFCDPPFADIAMLRTDFADVSRLALAPRPFFAYPPNRRVNARLNADWTRLVDSGLLPERARALRVPTLVLHGDADPRPAWPARALAELIPDARFVLLDDVGHEPFWERPEPMREHLRGFLA